MESHSALEQKRISIRNQKRREEIQSIISSKRKLMFLDTPSSPPKATLIEYFQLIANNKQTSKNVRCLSNLLAEDRPFDFFDSRGAAKNRQEVHQYSINLCDLMFNGVFRQYRSEAKQDVDMRIVCLTVVSNLLADREVDNYLLFGSICVFLKELYFSVDVWGIDNEIHEVGWMVANLIGKNIANNSEEDVKYILQWVEELLCLQETGMITALYKNIDIFITSIQLKYSTNPCELPEIYIASIINILTLTIQKNISTSKPTGVLLKAVQFLNCKLYIVLGYCPKAIVETMISKIIVLMGYISQELSSSAILLVQKVIGTCNLQDIVPRERKVLQNMQKIRINIAENYSSKLMQLLLLKQSKVKRHLISLILRLVKSPSEHIEYIIALLAGAGLEQVLANLAKTGDRQIILDIMHLTSNIQQISKGNYGFEFMNKLEQQLGQFQSIKQKDLHPL